jgi:hypothetical protein
MAKPLTSEALLKVPVQRGTVFLEARDYLHAVRGDQGDHMQLVALGYTIAAFDSAASPSGHARTPLASDASPPTLGDEIERVCIALHTSPCTLDAPAFALLEDAIAPRGAAAKRPAPHTQRVWQPARRWAGAALAAACACAVIAVVVAAGASLMKEERTNLPGEAKEELALSTQASRMLSLVLEERRYEKDSFINIPDAHEVAAYADKWEASRRELRNVIAALRQQNLDEADRRSLAEIERDLQTYADGYEQVLSMVRAGTIRSAQEANARVAAFKTFAHRIESNASTMAQRAAMRVQFAT